MKRSSSTDMSAKEFLEILKRRSQVEHRKIIIEFRPTDHAFGDFDAWIADAREWADTHPSRSGVTYAHDFFTRFPNAWRRSDAVGTPDVCRAVIYGPKPTVGRAPICFYNGDCERCWHEYMEDENGCGSGKN